MLAKVGTVAIDGLSVVRVQVEVSISARGMPAFDIVGLPARSVDESKQRIKTAFAFSGLEFPNKKITVNLAPADLQKQGSMYDLPIAVGIACAVLAVPPPEGTLFFGEISLNGEVRHTRGAFLLALFAQENGFTDVCVPMECAEEAAAVRGVRVFGVVDLRQLAAHLTDEKQIPCYISKKAALPHASGETVLSGPSFRDIAGQEAAKRALLISAAGGHNVIMTGPPGGGKTLLARALVSLLPPLTEEEALEVTKIQSFAGKIPPGGSLIRERPFRAPHHTISYSGLIGGGVSPSPGEITMAHRGVLFMDEFSEFPRFQLEALRQPMEDGFVSIARSKGTYVFPSKFTLVAATNPCYCGYLGHPRILCKCSPKRIDVYRQRISGPILDRIDMHIKVIPVDCETLLKKGAALAQDREGDLQRQISCARAIQAKRLMGQGLFTNSEMANKHILEFCKLTQKSEKLLNDVAAKFNLSSRAYFKVIKVARTIADVEGCNEISETHIAEAAQYRA